MTRFLVFSDQASAQSAVNQINARALELYTAIGYQTSNGQLIGNNLASGQPQPNAQQTTTWDIPRQTLLGTWVVLHPENSPLASQPAALATTMTVVQYVMQDFVSPNIQTDPSDGTWFPLPTPRH